MGRKTGGRKKGAANKRTREIADKAAAEGLTPLEYLLRLMRDERQEQAVRLDAAKAAAPYIHPRLQATEATIKGGLPPYEAALMELMNTMADDMKPALPIHPPRRAGDQHE
ncbi:hypothetical protein [Sinimarinibacterium flocculans]|nr:hypothetical protein [Sinimarinibacterium flocculans]